MHNNGKLCKASTDSKKAKDKFMPFFGSCAKQVTLGNNKEDAKNLTVGVINKEIQQLINVLIHSSQ